MLADETRGHEKDGQIVASLSYTWCRKNRVGDKEWVRDSNKRSCWQTDSVFTVLYKRE